jgi:predicted DsbA family dithiol-disulfide isomerase
MLSETRETAMAETERLIPVDVVSDVVCPWCFIGKRRLGRALGLRPGLPVEVRWRPFQLDPSIPAGGVDRMAYLTGKFGSAERIGEMHQRIEALGRAEGIAFDFNAIRVSPNTLDAHRLIRWAALAGQQGAVVEALFKAYFEQGRNIGDADVLAGIAAAEGLPREEIAERLAGDTDKATVEQEIATAGELGIRGVPFFIFDGRYAVSGAEAPETLAAALDSAEAEPDA